MRANSLSFSLEKSGPILDFDVECRPLAWYGGDFVTKQPTAISWKFLGTRGAPKVAVIGESDRSSLVLEEESEMLMAFREAWDSASAVTGHHIRGFDLPLIQGALLRLGLPLLGDKLCQDTKNDLLRVSGLSKSQENLGAMFELHHPKIPMNTTSWAAGNMLLPWGIEATRKRCVGDVKQHVELRQTMLDLGVLKEPTLWRAGARSPEYHA